MRNTLRKFVYAGAILALWAQAASAQGVGVSPQGMSFSPFKERDKPAPTQEEVDKQRAIDEAYKSATKKIPDKKVDPWATVRPAPNSATSSKQ